MKLTERIDVTATTGDTLRAEPQVALDVVEDPGDNETDTAGADGSMNDEESGDY